MTAMNTPQNASGTQSFGSNPALNPKAFARASEGMERSGMTARGAYHKTGFLLLLVVSAAAFGWSQVRVITVGGAQTVVAPPWIWIPLIGTLVLAVAGIFARRWIAPISVLYAIAQGATLGVVSKLYSLEWEGIVTQAVLITLALFLVTWLLYTLGIIRVTSKFIMGIVIATGGVALLFLASWLLPLIGIQFTLLNQPTPLGIAVAVIIVIIATLNLPVDFEFIKRSADNGAPKLMEWYGAFGLMVSLIWMYVSVLRLLALTRRR